MKLVHLKRKCESALAHFHDSCFELITECRAYQGEILKGDIKQRDLKSIQSLAFDVLDEIKAFEDYPRLKYWGDILSAVCHDIIRKTAVDGGLSQLAIRKEFYTTFCEEPGGHYKAIDILLHEAQVEGDQDKEQMLERAKQDIYELEEKLKQVIFLLNQLVHYPVGELSKG